MRLRSLVKSYCKTPPIEIQPHPIQDGQAHSRFTVSIGSSNPPSEGTRSFSHLQIHATINVIISEGATTREAPADANATPRPNRAQRTTARHSPSSNSYDRVVYPVHSHRVNIQPRTRQEHQDHDDMATSMSQDSQRLPSMAVWIMHRCRLDVYNT